MVLKTEPDRPVQLVEPRTGVQSGPPPLASSASRRGVYDLSPPNLELEDLTLFHRAILASTTSSTSRTVHSRLGTATNPKPKIAFLFLTNSDLSFAPLWNKFFNTTTNNKHLYNIYIHDPSVTIAPPSSVFQGRFITKAKKTERGSPSLISSACPLCLTPLSPSLSLTPLPLPSDCSLPLGHSHFVFLDLSVSVWSLTVSPHTGVFHSHSHGTFRRGCRGGFTLSRNV
uniref:Uncharacterized protein n=1 Tax=Fagus sylvatica TaxID=28930 RepID=A0A2N9HRL2_FAGSY